MFEAAGFEVIGEAADGRSAIEATRDLRPDLVLLDVVLSDMSGLEVARLLPDTQSVLLVSSRSAEDLGVSTLEKRRRFLRKDELSLERLREVAAGAKGSFPNTGPGDCSLS
jgi:DNA-binding response OmpR family regulator